MGMVRAGLGISVVPSLTLFHFQYREIVTRPLAWSGLTRRIYLVRRRDRGLSLAAQSLHDLVVQRKPTPDAFRADTVRKPRTGGDAGARIRRSG